MTLRQADPGASYQAYKAEIDQAIERVLASGQFILSEEVTRFEEEFARYIGGAGAVGVANGTQALQIALLACGVGPGDVVATVSLTSVATVAAIDLVGAHPLLVDIDPDTFTMDPHLLAQTLGSRQAPRVKAVIPVHLYGQPADIQAICEIAYSHGAVVIEDCAQAHGAALAERKVGLWGDAGAFSFYPTKNLGAFGDGGAVVASREEVIRRAFALREYGWDDRRVSESVGMNSRLDEIQAAVLRIKLLYLDRENARRRQFAEIYDSYLTNDAVIRPRRQRDATHVFHQYVVRCDSRRELMSYLSGKGIETAIHYAVPVHAHPAYSHVKGGVGGLGRTEQASATVLSLPIHPYLQEQDVENVGEAISRWDPGRV